MKGIRDPSKQLNAAESAVRRRLFALANGADRRQALTALQRLREDYKLRLPLVDRRWRLKKIEGTDEGSVPFASFIR